MSQDKIWSKIKSKVLDFKPDEYSPSDWKEMEKLLAANPGPGNSKTGLINSRLFLIILANLLLLSIVSAVFLYNRPHETADTYEAVTEESDQAQNSAPIFSENTGTIEKTPSSASANENTLAVSQNLINPQADRAIKKGSKQSLSAHTLKDIVQSWEGSPPASEATNVPLPISPSAFLKGTNDKTEASVDIHDEKTTTDERLTSLDAMNAIPTLPARALVAEVESLETTILPLPSKFDKRKLRFGAILGLNNSITDYRNLRTSHLPFGGLFVSMPLNRQLDLQLEGHIKFVNRYDLTQIYQYLSYSSTGFPEYSFKTEISFDSYTSFEFPLVVKYWLGNRLSALAGGRFCYLRDISSSISTSGSSPADIWETIPNNGFWNFDVNLVAGMEYDLFRRWLLDIRWNQGFLDLTPDNLYQDDAVHLNSDLQVSLRYVF